MTKKRFIYFGLLIITFIASTMYFSYAFFTNRTEGSGKLNIVVGTLDYKIESKDLKNNEITVLANEIRKIKIKITSLNDINSKYELYYNASDNSDLEVGYSIDSNNSSQGTIEANSKKEIIVIIKNNSNTDKTISFGVQGGLANTNLVLVKGKSLNNEIILCNYEVGETFIFNYTGDSQLFTTLCNGNYKVELWGAAGGSAYSTFATTEDGKRVEDGDLVDGGKGGYTSGNIYLSEANNFYIYVGGKGTNGKAYTKAIGGYNGGGHGGEAYQGAGAGGGATDVRLTKGNWDDFNSLKSRIIVAGAGSGTSNSINSVPGGSGGGLCGYDGKLNTSNVSHPLATGGSQTSGGTPGGKNHEDYIGYPGEFGIGGKAQGQGITYAYTYHGSGGGSGYYGGGGSGFVEGGVSSGAGGSSFISGHNGCDAIKEESTEDNIIHTGQSIHYSGYSFTNTVMIDGNGYNWTTEKGEYTGMPNYDGTSSMTGNSGNGYAKITYLGD